MNPEYLDEMYKKCISNLSQFIPEGFQEMKASSLFESSRCLPMSDYSFSDDDLHHNFFVSESKDKLTLFNNRFTIWIVPEIFDQETVTYCLVALNKKGSVKPEIAFKVTGVDNKSDTILKCLETVLNDIDDNERELSTFHDDDSNFSI